MILLINLLKKSKTNTKTEVSAIQPHQMSNTDKLIHFNKRKKVEEESRMTIKFLYCIRNEF